MQPFPFVRHCNILPVVSNCCAILRIVAITLVADDDLLMTRLMYGAVHIFHEVFRPNENARWSIPVNTRYGGQATGGIGD